MKQALIITGVKPIDRKLKLLPPRLQKKVVRQAMRAGCKILADEVRAQAPVLSGLTKSAVKVRATKSRKRGTLGIEVQISGKVDGLIKTDSEGKGTFYPAVVQYGREGVPPNPFMSRAFESKGEAARQVTIEALRQGVEREASQL